MQLQAPRSFQVSWQFIYRQSYKIKSKGDGFMYDWIQHLSTFNFCLEDAQHAINLSSLFLLKVAKSAAAVIEKNKIHISVK